MPAFSSTAGVARRTIAQSLGGKNGRGIGLVPFVAAGYPDLKTTGPTIKAMDTAGAAAIEIGFPFSDPIADGPTIQAAFTAALTKHLKVADVFAAVREVSGEVAAPLLAMLSYSIVFRYGPAKFFADARAAGFSGMIIPDLPPPQAQETCRLIGEAGLDTVLLVAPTTDAQRRREIASLCTGFVYYMALSGITGVRDELPADLVSNVRQLKGLTDRPVCVGFGISRPAHLKALAGVADGAIVGSAIVKRMTENASAGPERIAEVIGQYCRELLGG